MSTASCTADMDSLLAEEEEQEAEEANNDDDASLLSPVYEDDSYTWNSDDERIAAANRFYTEDDLLFLYLAYAMIPPSGALVRCGKALPRSYPDAEGTGEHARAPPMDCARLMQRMVQQRRRSLHEAGVLATTYETSADSCCYPLCTSVGHYLMEILCPICYLSVRRYCGKHLMYLYDTQIGCTTHLGLL